MDPTAMPGKALLPQSFEARAFAPYVLFQQSYMCVLSLSWSRGHHLAPRWANESPSVSEGRSYCEMWWGTWERGLQFLLTGLVRVLRLVYRMSWRPKGHRHQPSQRWRLREAS